MTLEFQSTGSGEALRPNRQDPGIEQAVAAAMEGLSIEELLERMANPAEPRPGQALDSSRPVRRGRPAARESDVAAEPSDDRLRRGTVVAIQNDNVFVDLGGKAQGIVPLEQFQAADSGTEAAPVAPGQEYEFVYCGYDEREGLVRLSRRGAVNHGGWEELHEGDVVEGMVTASNRGGLEVKINNIRAFMPAGQVDVKFTENLNALLGQKVQCQVIQLDRSAHRLVVSRRAILQEAIEQLREKTWAQLATGQICEGVVTRVQPYGAFVDIGGVEGLLHVSAMSYTRVTDPGKIVKTGDKIQVMVLGIDREKQRVSLGLKQLHQDPWSTAAEDFPVGATVTGKVTKLMDFGAFVELSPGVEGMVHVSELATKRLGHPREAVKVEQEVQAKVLGVDVERKRISLSIAQLQRDAAAAAAPPPVGTPASPKPKPAIRKQPLRGGL